MFKRLPVIIIAFLIMGMLTGCISTIGSRKKLRELEYTVTKEEDVPEELGKLIEEEKEHPMKFYYTVEGFTYIVIGYGEQKTSGYSIQVDEIYETEEEVIVSTTLMGPEQGEEVEKTATYPYLVLKTEENEKDMVFQ